MIESFNLKFETSEYQSNNIEQLEQQENLQKEKILQNLILDFKQNFPDIVEKIESGDIISDFYNKLDSKDKYAFLLWIKDEFDNLSEEDLWDIEDLVSEKPSKIFKLFSIKYDEIDKQIKLEEKEEKLEKNIEYTENYREVMLKKAYDKLFSKVLKNAPEYQQTLESQAQKLSQSNPDITYQEAYIYVFHQTYNTNPEFQQKIGPLDNEVKDIVSKISSEVESKIATNETLSNISGLHSELKTFATDKTIYDETLQSSIDQINFEKLKPEEKFKIGQNIYQIYKDAIQEDLSNLSLSSEKQISLAEINQQFEKYLRGEQIDQSLQKQFDSIFSKYISRFNQEFQTTYTTTYKEKGMFEYIKSAVGLVKEVLGGKAINNERLNIEKDGTVQYDFYYEEAPISLQITPDGNLQVLDYMKKDKNGLYTKALDKLNTFFRGVSTQMYKNKGSKIGGGHHGKEV